MKLEEMTKERIELVETMDRQWDALEKEIDDVFPKGEFRRGAEYSSIAHEAIGLLATRNKIRELNKTIIAYLNSGAI